MTIIVRPVIRSDFHEWSLLWEGYNTFYQRKLPKEIIQTTWDRFFDPDEPVHALVAEVNGKLLGLTHYLFHRNTAMINYSCYLQDLYTNESARGLGIGRALIEAVYEKAKEAGSPRVYWQTHETNSTAMKLYDQVAIRSGFLVYRKDI
jgi:GNAT superfamily N-acetyltransferase